MENSKISDLNDNQFLILLGKFFQDIPYHKWTVFHFTDELERHCAFGHLIYNFPNDTNIQSKAARLLPLTLINDSSYLIASEITILDNPKDRVLKAINMKLSGKEVYKDSKGALIVYPL